MQLQAHRWGITGAASVITALAPGAHATGTPTPGFYTPAGYLAAWSVADNGKVLITTSQEYPALWTQSGGAVPLNVLNLINVTRLSADATVMAGDGQGVPIRYVTGGSVQQIQNSGGITSSSTAGLSADGQTLLGYDAAVSRPWTWRPATGLQYLPGTTSNNNLRPTGLSADGHTAVGIGPLYSSWISTPSGGFQIVPGVPGRQHTDFRGVTRDGSVAYGGAWTYGNQDVGNAFTWTPANGYTDLGSLAGVPTQSDQRYWATAANADGSLVGGSYGAGTAWIWDAQHGMRDLKSVLTNDLKLNVTGWTLEQVQDISPDGTIVVGQAMLTATGESRAFIAVIPAPGSAAVILAGVAIAMRRRRRAQCVHG